MRPQRFILASALVLSASACGTLDSKTTQINVGDSKEQVLALLGTPADRQVNGPNEAWQYCVSGAGFGWNDHKLIWIAQGRVTGINSYRSTVSGCQGGMLPVRWETAPNSTVEIRVR